MAFELVEKRPRGYSGNKEWYTKPAVSISKGGVSLNAAAMDAFGISSGDLLLLMIDRHNEAIALKPPSTPEEQAISFKLGPRKKNQASRLTSPRIAKAFPWAVGGQFYLHSNRVQHVLEAKVDGKNRLGD